jgi:phosphoglycerol transferase MdoB-like AlkP superfamily enzyme
VFAAYLLLSGFFLKTVDIQMMTKNTNRIMDEVAANGFYTLGYALFTNHLSYSDYYPTINKDAAFSRASDLVFANKNATQNPLNPMERMVAAHKGVGNKNVVIVLEESLGSKFVGVQRHHPGNLTPYLDQLSRQGLFFTKFYATGTRTVRGLEAVLASFPPIPGASIVKRSDSTHVASLANVLKEKGYETVFIYGGRGVFDNMKPFMLKNGFNQFIEQRDYSKPNFTTVWGVSDEDIFEKSLETFDNLQTQGRPFFSTILTVSNHKPYSYPEGRIDLNPKARSRDHAVKYADWALGQFFEKAKSHAFFKETIFVVLGDHGARVYGADFIPIESYEIPLLIYSPFLIPNPKTINTLGCSMDLAPTILGLLGLEYKSTFYGRDLMHVPANKGYALLQHDRNVGLLTDNRLVVLGTSKKSSLYSYEKKEGKFNPIQKIDLPGKELIYDAIAFYQTAYDLYSHGNYR